jgi:hypothetical protein
MNEAYKRGYDKINWFPLPVQQRSAAPRAGSDFPCPRVITDTMDAVQHVDGKHYDSKSAFRAVTKARGYIEVGNDPARLRPAERIKPNEKDQIAAIDKAIARTLGT